MDYRKRTIRYLIRHYDELARSCYSSNVEVHCTRKGEAYIDKVTELIDDKIAIDMILDYLSLGRWGMCESIWEIDLRRLGRFAGVLVGKSFGMQDGELAKRVRCEESAIVDYYKTAEEFAYRFINFGERLPRWQLKNLDNEIRREYSEKKKTDRG